MLGLSPLLVDKSILGLVVCDLVELEGYKVLSETLSAALKQVI